MRVERGAVFRSRLCASCHFSPLRRPACRRFCLAERGSAHRAQNRPSHRSGPLPNLRPHQASTFPPLPAPALHSSIPPTIKHSLRRTPRPPLPIITRTTPTDTLRHNRHYDYLQGTLPCTACARLPRVFSMHRETSQTSPPGLTPLQDLITDDEIISDSYDIKEIDGVAYEADCRMITVGGESFGTQLHPASKAATPLTERRHRCQRIRRGAGRGCRRCPGASHRRCPLLPPEPDPVRQEVISHVPQGCVRSIWT